MTEPPAQPAYRWVIVFAAALILAISMGAIVNGMTALIVPILADVRSPKKTKPCLSGVRGKGQV